MVKTYYIRGAMRESGPFELKFLTAQARSREMDAIIQGIKAAAVHYFLYAEGREAMLRLEQIDWLKEE